MLGCLWVQGVKPFLYSYKFLYFGEIPIISYIELKFPIIPIKSGNMKIYSESLILTHSAWWFSSQFRAAQYIIVANCGWIIHMLHPFWYKFSHQSAEWKPKIFCIELCCYVIVHDEAPRHWHMKDTCHQKFLRMVMVTNKPSENPSTYKFVHMYKCQIYYHGIHNM